MPPLRSALLQFSNGDNCMAATNELTVFRNSPNPAAVLEFCKGYLMMEDTSEFSQFHALSILHYVIVKHWTSTFMTESMHDEVRSYIFSLLNARISQFLDDSTNLGNFSYICGKLFQVHVSLWKCSWLQCERAEIEFFMQSIRSLVLPSGGGSIKSADVVSTKKTKAGTIYLC